MAQAWNEPARGIAGNWARAACTVYSVALAMFLGHVLIRTMRSGDWMALVVAGWGFVVAGIALLALAVAVAAAALGQGSLPRWGLVVAGVLFAVVGSLSALSLDVTGSPWLVGSVLASCLLGLAAVIIAVVKDMRRGSRRRNSGT